VVVAKPEWGSKHICQSCGASFYDLMRTPIVCPKCDSVVVVPEAIVKPRRPFPLAAKIAATGRGPMANQETAFDPEVDPDALEADNEEEEEDEDEDEESRIEASDGGDVDESGLIEDASDTDTDDHDTTGLPRNRPTKSFPRD
jgi:uncharacterized protein (TIGR02300 family)